MGCGGSKEEEGPSVAELEAATAAMPAWAQLNGRRGADATVDAYAAAKAANERVRWDAFASCSRARKVTDRRTIASFDGPTTRRALAAAGVLFTIVRAL